jgi:putative transcriptional regulator
MASVTPPTGPGLPTPQPTHVIGDEILMDYAAGSCTEAVALAVASHLTLCPEARRRLEAFEQLGGALLEDLEPAEMDADALDVFERLDMDDAAAEGAAAEADDGSCVCGCGGECGGKGAPERAAAEPRRHGALLPAPLADYLPGDVDVLPWRPVMRGLEEYDIDVAGAKAKLLRIKGGMAMPQHTHAGTEMTLVLAGGFSDERGHFLRGDIAVTDREVDHQPVADEGEDCICLAVTDAPLRLTGPIGRFLNPFVRF